MSSRTTRVSSAAAALFLAVGLLVNAGPLDPPAGPVASTYKTLAEVEPRIAINAVNTPGDADSLFKISQPGSYYLTGNIAGVVGKHGIEITASGVTLDLRGFDLAGVPSMGTFDGVTVSIASLTNITVRNGSVRNWGRAGVNLNNTSFVASCSRVDRVTASGNASAGILLGSACVADGCAATANQTFGIHAGGGGTVTGCSASGNGTIGIAGNSGCTFSQCSAFQNAGAGMSGSTGCTFTQCSAYSNDTTGIAAGTGGLVAHCTAYNNSSIGIVIGTGSTALNCLSNFNGSHGIDAASGGTISGCTTTRNVGDGIRAGTQALVLHNTCSIAGNNTGDGAAIHLTGADNRVEGNICTGSDRGIDVDSSGNIIIKNTCSGNSTNWDIAAGNALAPIVIASGNAAAVVGNTYSGSLGSTDPNANFTY